MSLAFIAVAAAIIAPAIIRRADIPDQRYLELGAKYPAVLRIGGVGDATLIAPQWLITAAHVARDIARRGASASISIAGEQATIDAVIVHPKWTEMGDHDVGLIKLARPIAGLRPLSLYRGNAERGHTAALVGHGGSGTGDSRARVEDGRRRAATSAVDSVSVFRLYFSFDRPPRGTATEGAPGPGDSGGPAIIDVDGRGYVAGISSAGFDGYQGPGTYGAIDVFTRVSAYAAWIDSVMSSTTQRGAQTRPADVVRDTVLPGTPAGVRYAAFLRAVRSGTDSAVRAFAQDNFDEREFQSRPALVPNLVRIANAIRRAPIAAIERADAYEVAVRFNTSSGPMTIALVTSSAAPHKLVDWRRLD